MKRSIIFVNVGLFFQRDAVRFGCTYLMKKGYSVEIWDLLTERPMDFRATMPLYNGDNYYEYTYKEFMDNVNKHMQDIYVILYAQDYLFLRTCSELINLGCRYILITNLGGVHVEYPNFINRSLSFFYRNIIRLFKNSRKELQVILSNKIDRRNIVTQYLNAQQNNPPIAILTGTHESAKRALTTRQLQGNVIYTHATDYDRFIEENRKKNHSLQKYIVFCDSGFGATHYDLVIVGKTLNIDGTKLYMQIESLLSKLEEHYNLPAVILGHPHVKYESGMFSGREIVFNRTCEMTRNAAVFVLNTSTAMNYALLYDIPILQVANQEFKQAHAHSFEPNLYDFIRNEAKNVFGGGFLDLDDKAAMDHPWDYVKKASPIKRKSHIQSCIIDNDTQDKCIYESLEEVIRHELYGTEKSKGVVS